MVDDNLNPFISFTYISFYAAHLKWDHFLDDGASKHQVERKEKKSKSSGRADKDVLGDVWGRLQVNTNV